MTSAFPFDKQTFFVENLLFIVFINLIEKNIKTMR